VPLLWHCRGIVGIGLVLAPLAWSGDVRGDDLPAAVQPRRFGLPGGVAGIRGWYVWNKFNADDWTAEVSHEGTGEKYKVRVLPWATTYRHLVYGGHPDELLPGERVNLFFAPDRKHQRGFLVHFQDELCQMRGHGHCWEVLTADADGRGFTARILAGKKPLDDKTVSFTQANDATHWRGGKHVKAPTWRQGDRLYLTWSYQDGKRQIHLSADDASLDAVQKVEEARVSKRLADDGLAAQVEAVEEDMARLLIFPTFWAQAGRWKPDQALDIRATAAGFRPAGQAIPAKLLTRKNLGTYSSGATEVSVRLSRPADAAQLRTWMAGKVIRVAAGK
jgi:hypothetical protein